MYSAFQRSANNGQLFVNGQCCGQLHWEIPEETLLLLLFYVCVCVCMYILYVCVFCVCAPLTGSSAPRGHLLPAMAHMSPCDNTALLIHTAASTGVCAQCWSTACVCVYVRKCTHKPFWEQQIIDQHQDIRFFVCCPVCVCVCSPVYNK